MTEFNRRQILAATGALSAATGLGLGSAFAQAYPTRPITLVVPWGAGGGTDATARIIGAILEKDLGQPVQRRQPHRRLGRRRPLRDRDRRTRWLHHRHDHGGNHHDASSGTDRAQSDQLHAAGAAQRRSAGRAGEMPIAPTRPRRNLPTRSRRHRPASSRRQVPVRVVSGISHSSAGCWRMGLKPDHVHWVPSNGAAPAMQDLAAGGIDIVTCSVPEAKSMIDAGKARSRWRSWQMRSQSAFKDVPTLKSSCGHRLFGRRLARHCGTQGSAGRHGRQAHCSPQEGLELEGVQRLHGRSRLRREVG